MQASDRPGEPDARVRLASLVDRDWLTPNAVEILHRLDDVTGTVKAVAVERYDALMRDGSVLSTPIQTYACASGRRVAEAGSREGDTQLLRRLSFAGRAADLPELARARPPRAPNRSPTSGLPGALAFDEQRALDR